MKTCWRTASHAELHFLFLVMPWIFLLGLSLGTSGDVAAQPQPSDYGGAPDTGPGTSPGNYNTQDADGGPRHPVTLASPFIGGCVDIDGGTLQNNVASADDLAVGAATVGLCIPAGDDEDGILVGSPVPSPGLSSSAVQVIMTAAASPADCHLDAWMDFNHDGDFDDLGEQIATNQVLLAGSGANTLTFLVPAAAVPGPTVSRFRCSSVGGLGPTGPAPDGEVQDIQIPINPKFLP